MLRWGRKKQAEKSRANGHDAAPQAEAGSEIADEWAFLREQPDHDADEMAAVHGTNASELDAQPDWQEAADTGVESTSWERPGTSWRPPTRPLSRRERAADGPGIPAEQPLRLRIDYVGELYEHTLTGKALLGRADEESGIYPDLDFSEDDAVSRRHARIFPQGGCWVVQDLHSTNGTIRNGEELEPGQSVVLRPGDLLEMGCAVRIRVAEAPGWDLDYGAAGETQPEDAEEAHLTAEDLALQSLVEEAGGAGYLSEPRCNLTGPVGQLERLRAGADLLDLARSHARWAGWASRNQAEQVGRTPETARSYRDAYDER